MATAMRSREQREGLTTTYYPGTSDPLQAATINVEPGAEIRSMDFSLRPSGVFHIRGHISGLGPGPAGFGGAGMLGKGKSRFRAAMPERHGPGQSQSARSTMWQCDSGAGHALLCTLPHH